MSSASILATDDSNAIMPTLVAARDVERLLSTFVLVVDDDHLNLEIAKCTLEGFGVRVTTASSGFEALEALNAGRFDCVFMDYQMPVMDGIETTMKIRAPSRFSSTCVIGLTSNASSHDRERYLCAGMNDVVGKPYRVEQLIGALVRNLDLN